MIKVIHHWHNNPKREIRSCNSDEKAPGRARRTLEKILSMMPKIFSLVEQPTNKNGADLVPEADLDSARRWLGRSTGKVTGEYIKELSACELHEAIEDQAEGKQDVEGF